MKSRITPLIESRLGNSQLGFRKGRGASDGIFQLRIKAERLIEKKRNDLYTTLTLKRPFDKIKSRLLLVSCWQIEMFPTKRLD